MKLIEMIKVEEKNLNEKAEISNKLNYFLAQGLRLFGIYILTSTIVKAFILARPWTEWLDNLIAFVLVIIFVISKGFLSQSLKIRVVPYTIKKRIFLIVGTLFHGTVILVIKNFRYAEVSNYSWTDSILQAIILGIMWGVIFHISVKYKVEDR